MATVSDTPVIYKASLSNGPPSTLYFIPFKCADESSISWWWDTALETAQSRTSVSLPNNCSFVKLDSDELEDERIRLIPEFNAVDITFTLLDKEKAFKGPLGFWHWPVLSKLLNR